MLAPPGESHDEWTQEDIDGDADDIIQGSEGAPGNNWLDGTWTLAAHPLHGTAISLPSDSTHGHSHSTGIDDFFGGGLTAIHAKHFEIEWIRIYKNPRITKLAKLREDGVVVGTYNWRNWRNPDRSTDIPVNPVIKPPDFLPRRARIFPSLWSDYDKLLKREVTLDEVEDDYFWVNINRDGELLPDDDKPGNSGLVTATENNTVVPGDIVAIAINVKLRGYKAVKEFITPEPGIDRDSTADPPLEFPPLLHSQVPAYLNPVSGPREADWEINWLPLLFNDGQKTNPVDTVWARNFDSTREIAGGTIIAAVGIDGVGILNPNYPLERITQNGPVYYLHADSSVTATEWGHRFVDGGPTHGYHTIVYQFTVTEAHESLNALGKWLAGTGNTVVPFNVQYRTGAGFNYEYADFYAVHPKGEGGESHGYTYQVIKDLRKLKSDHEREFGFAVPFADDSDDNSGGKRLSNFLDVSDFLAGAGDEGYIPYPESPVEAKKTQYREHRLTFSSTNPDTDWTGIPEHRYGVYELGGPYRIKKTDLDRNGDGILEYMPVIDDGLAETNAHGQLISDGRVRHYTVSEGFYKQPGTEFPHHLPPTYDTAEKDPIYYPRVIDEYVGATPKLDVPTETQTGTFMVTLRFQEDYGDAGKVAPLHDTSEDVLAALQAALAAGVENGTVTGLSRLGVVDDSTQYQVTLVPALGVVGELTLHVPPNTVVAVASGLGNLAATFTVPIDTALQLVSGQSVEIVEPEGDAYQTGDEIVVRVPFETDGLTFEGENAPYVTIYLGAEEPANARHATWQKGAEQSGSTVVPFVYVLQEADPSAESVSVDLNSLSIPRETTLMSGAGLERRGTDDPAVDVGEVAPVPVDRR